MISGTGGTLRNVDIQNVILSQCTSNDLLISEEYFHFSHSLFDVAKTVESPCDQINSIVVWRKRLMFCGKRDICKILDVEILLFNKRNISNLYVLI